MPCPVWCFFSSSSSPFGGDQDPKEQLLLGPAYAIAKILKRNNLTIADVGVWELHEAFAGQVLANLNALNSESFAKDGLKVSAKIGEVGAGGSRAHSVVCGHGDGGLDRVPTPFSCT